MPFSDVAFKKAMLAWDPVGKKARTDCDKVAKEHPEAAEHMSSVGKAISEYNKRVKDLLDKVVVAKDANGKTAAAKTALGAVKQYQGFATTTQVPPDIQKALVGGLAALAKGLAT